jgi:hypothetical protein
MSILKIFLKNEYLVKWLFHPAINTSKQPGSQNLTAHFVECCLDFAILLECSYIVPSDSFLLTEE